MMTGKTLIHAIREDEKNYPHLCEIQLFLYDEKDRLDTKDDAVFSEDLFAENLVEKDRFLEYLNHLEGNKISYMDIKISKSHVIAFSKSSNLTIFSRKERLDPMIT